jgi:hypothetical protein
VQTLRHEGVRQLGSCLQASKGRLCEAVNTLSQIRGLYKGLSPPLALTGFTNAVMFAINSQMKKIVASFKQDPASAITLPQVGALGPYIYLTRSSLLTPSLQNGRLRRSSLRLR